MSGILLAIASGRGGRFRVTCGDSPSFDLVGYQLDHNSDAEDWGSISPVGTFRGSRIVQLATNFNDTGSYFRCIMDGSLAQNFFSKLFIDTGSSVVVLATNNVTNHAVGGGPQTIWRWGTPIIASPVWDASDVGQVRLVKIV